MVCLVTLWQLPWRTTDSIKTLLTPGLLPMQREALWPAFTPTMMLLCGLRSFSARLGTRLLLHVTWVKPGLAHAGKMLPLGTYSVHYSAANALTLAHRI